MKKSVVSWTAVFVWMTLIFYLSHQPATQSNQLSKGLTEKILQVKGKGSPDTKVSISILNSSIRNNAHFFLYLILGMLVLNAIKGSGLKYIGVALLICILYAIFDEVHQTFIPGRGVEIKDVLIDGAGSAAGIILYLLSTKITRMNINIKRTV